MSSASSSASGKPLSAVVRAVLREAGGALRLPAVWAAVRAREPVLASAVSKTHFKRRVVRAMELRGDLIKTHVAEDAGGGAVKDFFAFRLKHTRRNGFPAPNATSSPKIAPAPAAVTEPAAASALPRAATLR